MRTRTRWLAATPALAFLGVFFIYPVAAIITRGLRPEGSWQLDVVSEVVRDHALWSIVWFTFWQALASTALTLAVALPCAHVFARYRFFGKRTIWAALIVPFVLPTVVVGAAFTALIGPRGAAGIDLTETVWAILIAHVFFNYAVVVRMVSSAWAQIDPRSAEAAKTLGAGPLRTFWQVTLPALRPAVVAAAAIVFLFTFTSFGVVVLLGGPAQRTLEVEIYRQTARNLNLDIAAVLALGQLMIITVALLATRRAERAGSESSPVPDGHWTTRPGRGAARLAVGTNLAIVALLFGTPLAVLVVRSLRTSRGWGLDHYRALGSASQRSTLFVPAIEAVRNSLGFAALATIIAVVVGSLAAVSIAGSTTGSTVRSSSSGRAHRSRHGLGWLDTALMLPLGTSAVTIGFGFLIALDHPPLDLRNSVWLVPIAQALVAIPFVVRVMVPALRSIDPRLREAASVLGASSGEAWVEVDLPVLRRAATVAAGFAFAISLGEFGATIFLARADQPTLPVAIYRLLGRPGMSNTGQAMALSVILMAMTTAAVLIIDRIRPSAPGVS